MKQRTICAAVLLTALFSCLACANKGSTAIANQQTSSTQGAAGELHLKAPDGWVTETPSSSMRVGQYKLPKAEGDKEDASLVVYYFGATQGGSPQANIDRWIGQIQQPDGGDSKAKAKTETMTVNGLKVTTVDVTGLYTAEMAPGSKTFHNDANYRLRAAVIETPKGNYFVKLAGPDKTVARWDQSYNDFLKSVEFK
ncbi:MAG: hypothetical protein DMF72_14935 [Acidobacteria bacterium]|nr:MAG: hypothetical protein DMF72_14935 [Acidobacteriota bacterium]